MAQVTGISQDGGKWSVRYTSKKGERAGQEQTSAGLDAVVLADTLLAQTGAPRPAPALCPAVRWGLDCAPGAEE